MRKSSGLAFVLTLTYAALHIPASTPAVHDLVGSGARTALFVGADPKSPDFVGGCTAYDTEPPSRLFPYDDNLGEAKKVLDIFFGSPTPNDVSKPLPADVRYVIAFAPDPRHTNLSFMFDREMSILLQATQNEGYDYNSSWMPWQHDNPQPLVRLEDQQDASDLRKGREACPGLLLFRRRPDSDLNHPVGYPYEKALLVFVIGEQATGGINEEQWANAINWLVLHAVSTNGILSLLGPTFTGSLVSMDRDLNALYNTASPGALQKKFPDARIFSGSVSSCSDIQWFQNNLPRAAPGHYIQFGTFQENDAVHISRFLKYLLQQGTRWDEIAILSEDETAYGSSNLQPACDLPGNEDDGSPTDLVYPRDISALREAYEKQSVFDSWGFDFKGHQHPILRDVTGESGSGVDITDTVPSLSGSVTAVDQEAYLYGLVSFLRTHHTRVLILRCTNPLDTLFLTRFFHRAYPDARIVTVGSDLLFRREIDTTEFRGVLSLSSYPLVPRNNHWSMITGEVSKKGAHNHVIFQGHLAEGTYIAIRYLLHEPVPVIHVQDSKAALQIERVIPTEDYAQPYWLNTRLYLTATCFPTDLMSHPATWLAVVGRDGYWPVANLNSRVNARSTIVNLVQPTNFPAQQFIPPKSKGALPLPWLVGTLLILALVCYQLTGVTGKYRSDGLLAAFYIARDKWQSMLLGVSCALAMMLLCETTALFLIPLDFSTISHDVMPEVGYSVALLLSLGIILALFSRFQQKGTIFGDDGCKYSHDGQEFGDDSWKYGAVAAVTFTVGVGLLHSVYFYAFLTGRNASNDVALFYRMAHFTNGVSPLVPILLLTFGFYLWNWQVMAGRLMLTEGCPTLPELMRQDEYQITEKFGSEILDIADPLRFKCKITLLPIFFASGSLLCFFNNLPLLSMEGKPFDRIINTLLLLALTLTMAEAVRLYSTWILLKKLLVALSRLRLRRTIANLRPLEGNSVWGVSGNLRRVQYELFVKQLGAAQQCVALYPMNTLDRVLRYGNEFRYRSESSQGRSAQWDEGVLPAGHPCCKMRQVLSEGVADVYEELYKVWRCETGSLNLTRTDVETEEDKPMVNRMQLAEYDDVQRAEEFVAYHYISFIQNITARMRTMTLSMMFLFITVCFAVSFYPFVPRTEIVVWLILYLALIASVVAYVYAGMERDEILSYITNTQPGRLGTDFWLRLAGFLAGPAIGILATQFPYLSDSVLRWLQPGLDAISH